MDEKEQQLKQFMNMFGGNREYYITIQSPNSKVNPPFKTDGEDWMFVDFRCSNGEIYVLWTRTNNKI